MFAEKTNSDKSFERIERFVVLYDIFENEIDDFVAGNRRTRIARMLLDYGIRSQLSVFEIEIRHKRFNELLKRIKKECRAGDKIYIYPLDKKNRTKIKRIGNIDSIVNDYFI
ncbi:MAG: CRISPR-associated endonuclease Cas2 [bacterium]